ncbi:MAG: AAA family ATPase [Terriglobia bacterium]|jgi:predicted ATPase
MLTKLTIRNFKRFGEVEIDLGNPVVFIGPNNSGKTTALQALALWEIGLKLWVEKRSGKRTPEKRPGVTINRRDLISCPVPDANLLWRDLHVRDVKKINDNQQTSNVLIELIVEGVSEGESWTCGLEFYYANAESFYCRPARLAADSVGTQAIIPDEAKKVRLAFLQPMSGLLANETRLDQGAINVRLGEGRTAEVLRNLCYRIYSAEGREARLDDVPHEFKQIVGEARWNTLKRQIKRLFGVELDPPQYIAERGEIEMTYTDASGVRLDISSSGRGLQQTLLLLSHLKVNPRSVLLLDEPDAHLEILRQREIYQQLTEAAKEQQSQVIIASHSEVILAEAADRDTVVAFVGKPHRIDDRGSQLLKSLKQIGFDQYYQAEQTGWVLYLEGSTGLAILQALARALGHPAYKALERPFVSYVANQPQKARDHFRGLREGKTDLVGYALFDRVEQSLQSGPGLDEYMWTRREIENYLCSQDTLLAFAADYAHDQGPLFEQAEKARYIETMQRCIEDYVPRAAQRDPGDRWWIDTKASDDFLDRLFEAFFKAIELPNTMRKTNYHVLAGYVPKDKIDPEISRVLDSILEVSRQAKPAPDPP